MTRLTLGISQIGGKFRLLKKILKIIPNHEFYLEPFLGSAIVLLNKPRCRYECGNDINSELINYLLIVREHPKEFDKLKKGVLGLVSQEIYNRIINGKLKPKNDIERAYFFYYINKFTFGGLIPRFDDNYGLTEEKYNNINYKGFKGIKGKTTRPYTNNDCGLLTPLNPEAIKRLRYINLTCYPYDKVYDMFYTAFYEKKGLKKECFIYFDPPYPGTECYYGNDFSESDHRNLINILKECPFHWLLTIGSNCDLYLDELSNFRIEKVSVKYSVSSNNQYERAEYFITNYDPSKVPLMRFSYQKTIKYFLC